MPQVSQWHDASDLIEITQKENVVKKADNIYPLTLQFLFDTFSSSLKHFIVTFL